MMGWGVLGCLLMSCVVVFGLVVMMICVVCSVLFVFVCMFMLFGLE